MAAELFPLDNTEKVLREFAVALRKAYKDELAKNGHIATGNLSNIIEQDVVVDGHTYIVYLDLRDYWQYVEWDTKPHWPPRDAILKWIRVKKIVPRPDSKGRIPTPKQLAFLISRAMAGKSPNQAKCKNPQGGTTGTHDLETAREQVLDSWMDRIRQAIGEDATIYITNLLVNVLQ